ncbi:FHA domain-containing protein [Antrihabitans sp. YC3-6]|uniref:FHA domain-containing protein n=1 Tax=Antrihabitans stalagmiti TaxID=2799499 RepID=A0A934U5J4_9NOCA|nr:FHA domain-containing protein [Antrihabitans stalagmiti]MBJ8341609.1 FHA domain-containing protein [Antrihabitans stalagmiti]
MQQRPFTVGISDGSGLIARFGDVVLFAIGADEAVAQLLGAVDSAARTQYPGAGLPDRLAPVAFGAARGVAFGVVAPTADGAIVLLKGVVAADIRTNDGGRSLVGNDGPRFVVEAVPDHATTIGLRTADRSTPYPRPHTDLQAGIVPGGGFAIVRATLPTEPPRHMETVATVRIPAGASNTPGFRSPQETAAATPVISVLSTKDGAVYPLDRPYVIGRAPLSDEAVANATASPIVVEYDPYISRVHAYITVERGDVFVRDALTPAGTFIAAPGAEDWTQVGETPARLDPGWTLRIGEWTVTHLAGGAS